MLDVDRYLERLGLEPADATCDREGLTRLHRAHLVHVPFETLDLVFGDGVPHDRLAAVSKIVGPPPADSGHPNASRRGGWCFELNGAFGLLLEAIGFDVLLIGAAVLLDGPNIRLDHLALEVSTAKMSPMLVDVGFGDSFDVPLDINDSGVQHGGSSDFQLFASPQGTTLTRLVDGVPDALFRFKRVGHDFADFAPVAASLQGDPSGRWATKPVATRLLDADSLDRVTLTRDQLSVRRSGELSMRHVDVSAWDATLLEWFGIDRSTT